jgi:hypothetical protein
MTSIEPKALLQGAISSIRIDLNFKDSRKSKNSGNLRKFSTSLLQKSSPTV